jgi:hypothetical protein
MPRLVFRCPDTGKTITTNVVLDHNTLLACADMSVELGCGCGLVHSLKMKDAAWEEPSMPPMPAAAGRRALRPETAAHGRIKTPGSNVSSS